MSQNNAAGDSRNYLIAMISDPRVVPTYSPKGTIGSWAPQTGPVVILQKDDDGTSTNWSLLTAGGAAPTGPAGGDLTGTYPNPRITSQTGNAGKFLTTDGSTVSWASVGASGANQQLSNLLITAVNADINPGVTNTINLGVPGFVYASVGTSTIKNTAGNTVINVGTTGGFTSFNDPGGNLFIYADSGNRQIADGSGSAVMDFFPTNAPTMISNGGGVTSVSLGFPNANNTANRFVRIKAPDVFSAPWTLTLPADNGNSGEFLQTDGSGVTSWAPGGTTGDPDSVPYFDGSGTLTDDTNVEYSPSITQTFPPFAVRGYFAKSDDINVSATGFVFGSTDTSTDSFTTNLGMITGSNTTVAAATATGGVLFGTGAVSDAGASANTGAVNVFTGPNNGAGSSGGMTIASGQTTDGQSGALVISSGNSSNGSTGSVNINTGSSSGGSSGDLKITAGPSDGSAFNGEAALGTAPVTVVGASADSGVVQVESGPVLDSTATGASGAVTIKSGDNMGLGASGTVNIGSGAISNASDTANTGNIISISGSNAGSGNSGGVAMGSGNAQSGNSGFVGMSTGDVQTGASGDSSIKTGQVQATSTSKTGDISFNTGDIIDVGSSGNTGTLFLQTGGNAGSGDSGPIVLVTGTVAGGTRGQIIFQDGTEGTPGDVWTSTGTGGEGSWAPASGGGANVFLSNLTSPTSINQDLIFGKETPTINGGSAGDTFSIITNDLPSGPSPILIQPGDGDSGNGGNLSLIAGSADTGTGGTVALTSGSSNSGTAGDINITAGVVGAGGTNPGTINIIGSESDSTGVNGGNINITAGIQTDSGNGGSIVITSGASTDSNSGDASFFSADSTAGDSGVVSIGSGVADAGASGEVDLLTGGADTSGNIFVQTGTGVTSSGNFNIVTGAATAGGSGSGNLTTGNASGGSDSGSLIFTTGTADTGADAGDFTFNAGTSTGGGSDGDFNVNAHTINLITYATGAVQIDASANTTDGDISILAGRDIGLNAVQVVRITNDTSSLYVPTTITAGGTTGAQTINKMSGRVNFAAAASSLVVTCDKCSATSLVFATVASNDATMKSVQAVSANGSFTLFANAAAAAETKVNFWVINP